MTLSLEQMEQLQRSRDRLSVLPLAKALGGEEFKHQSGVFHRRVQTLDGNLCHGPFPLKQAQWPSFAHCLCGLAGSRMLYLDTETTGLAGGSGTYAFLIGLAYFEQSKLHIEQLLMRSHCEEKAMLEYLIERVQQCDGLVTFNGKSFDVPLLQTRLIMNRLGYDLTKLPHFDLLPVARRLWSGFLDNCRLETLETNLLDLPRHADVPGWMIPQIFFRYLQSGCARGLARIAEHNRRDMLTMVGLVAGLSGYVDDPYDWSLRFKHQAEFLHYEDLALSRQLFRARRFTEACKLLQRCFAYWEQQLPPVLALRHSGTLLARLYRRLGEREAAAKIWSRLIEYFPQDPDILEQIAKQQEHGEKNLTSALHWVDRGLQLGTLTSYHRRRFNYRRERLLRRLSS